MLINTATRSAMATQILNAMAAGTAASPKLEFYTGVIPASMGATIADTLLAELTLPNTVGTVSNGVLTVGAITEDSSANATGKAGWARVLDRDGSEIQYLTVTATGGAGDVEINTVDIVEGGPVLVTSFTISIGGG